MPVILHCILYPIKQECITLWILVQSDTVNDLTLFVGQCDLYFMSSDFALYLWLYLTNRHHILVLVQFYTASDLVFFVGHCDLYFIIH